MNVTTARIATRVPSAPNKAKRVQDFRRLRSDIILAEDLARGPLDGHVRG